MVVIQFGNEGCKNRFLLLLAESLSEERGLLDLVGGG
jgi:hypothetical protein